MYGNVLCMYIYVNIDDLWYSKSLVTILHQQVGSTWPPAVQPWALGTWQAVDVRNPKQPPGEKQLKIIWTPTNLNWCRISSINSTIHSVMILVSWLSVRWLCFSLTRCPYFSWLKTLAFCQTTEFLHHSMRHWPHKPHLWTKRGSPGPAIFGRPRIKSWSSASFTHLFLGGTQWVEIHPPKFNSSPLKFDVRDLYSSPASCVPQYSWLVSSMFQHL